MILYAGLTIGDIGWGLLSSPSSLAPAGARAVSSSTSAFVILYFLAGGHSLTTFYVLSRARRVRVGYWAVFVVDGGGAVRHEPARDRRDHGRRTSCAARSSS